MEDIILEMRGITKVFGDFFANNHINLKVQRGSVHSIVGENGAGKTTLMNILYGIYAQTTGDIWVNGKKVIINTPSDAIALGIGMIHQHFKLIPAMTVGENVMLGAEPTKNGFVLDTDHLNSYTQELSQRYSLEVNPKDEVADLSVGIRQRVEILKALYRKATILILDEPTALLTPQETRDLFKVINKLRDDGITILFISHKLKEVMEISDRVTVLRDGVIVDTVEKKDTDEVHLARLMVGRDVYLKPAPEATHIGEVILKVENLSAVNEYHRKVLEEVSFDIRAGEILGIAGIDGNGQTELVHTILGLKHKTSGRITVSGKDVTKLHVDQVRNSGIGIVPEDRLKEGLVLDFNIEENLALGLQRKQPFSRNGIMDWKTIADKASDLIERYDVRPRNPFQKAVLLSGGNQQKVIVAREIYNAESMIIAAQPTRGLDIAATDFVHAQLIGQRDSGKAIMLISLSLEEILLLSTRIAVIRKGRIVDIVNKTDTNAEELGHMMLVGRRD